MLKMQKQLPGLLQQLFFMSSQKILTRLQTAQKSAVRLLTGSKRYEHITPILAYYHCLPVSLRINFKILLITFKALHGLAPCYILDLLTPYEPVRTLRSLGRGVLSIPESRLISRGDRAFAVRAPRLWNEALDFLCLLKLF